MMYIDESRQTSKEFRRLWALAFRGLTDIGLDISWSPKQILINVNANKTATIPDDYLDWVRVGVFNSDGELSTLRVNEQLTTYKGTSTNRITDIQSQLAPDVSNNQYPYWFGYWGEQDYEHYFGAGSTLLQAGECRVDATNNIILLDPSFSYTQIVLEYICSPVMDDDYAIDFKAQEALIAWLAWKDVVSLPSTRLVNMQEKTFRQRNYQQQKTLARKRIKPFRLATAEQLFREGQQMSVKG
jgi:hypothetical protein